MCARSRSGSGTLKHVSYPCVSSCMHDTITSPYLLKIPVNLASPMESSTEGVTSI
jgi:hypothetical protein